MACTYVAFLNSSQCRLHLAWLRNADLGSVSLEPLCACPLLLVLDREHSLTSAFPEPPY